MSPTLRQKTASGPLLLFCMSTVACYFFSCVSLATSLQTPSWDFDFPGNTAYCVDAKDSSRGDANKRWVFAALPSGTPPAGGWPVFVSLTTDNFPANKGEATTCGPAGQRIRKTYSAFSTPAESLKSCFNSTTAASVSAAATASTSSTGGGENGENDGVAWPPWPPHHHGGCMYDQQAGQLWAQRMLQYLVSNGVAVLQLNPIVEDSWDAGPWYWTSGPDKPFLTQVFAGIKAGDY
eukprot:UC1_evm1s824